MDVTLRNLDGMLLVLVRVSAIIMVAPFFNQTTIPRRTKFFLSFFLFSYSTSLFQKTSIERAGRPMPFRSCSISRKKGEGTDLAQKGWF